MKTYRQYVVGIFLVAVLIIPSSAAAQSVDSIRLSLLRQLVVLLQQQLELLQAQQSEQVQVMSRSNVPVGTYDASASVVARIDDPTTRQFFSRVRELTPDQYLPLLEEFKVVGSRNGFDAYVLGRYDSRIGIDWEFGVTRSFLQEVTAQDRIDELIVHEIAHIIAETDNLDYFGTESCHELFQAQGCLDDATIYGQFVLEFWDTAKLDAAEAIQDQQVSSTYIHRRHPSEFVSEYAASSPAEDFAESFAHYVLYEDSEQGTVADQKITFFDQFSSARAHKAEILTNL